MDPDSERNGVWIRGPAACSRWQCTRARVIGRRGVPARTARRWSIPAGTSGWRHLSGLFLLGLLLFVGLSPLSVRAQERELVVSVRGPTGPVPEARVLLTFGESLTRSRITDSLGMAPFPSLPPGSFRIRVEAYGYQPYEDSPADPGISGEWRLEVELTPLPVELEGVTVRADPIQIQRQNTEFATTVQEEAIQLLPVAYDVKELVALTPGARAENVWGGASFQANSYRIDGLSANHPGIGGSLLEPSPLWIDRVEIRGLGSGAEHGGFQGGQVNVVTKRGSNVFSGMLRTTGTNDLLSASNLTLTEAKSEVKNRVDLEGEVSGPLIRDRLFYYLGGTFTDRSARALNHVDFEGRYSPLSEDLEEVKTFGKLTWTPGPADEINVSGAYLRDDVANYGLTGYEGNGAAPTLLSPTWFANAEWTHVFPGGALVETQVNRFTRKEDFTSTEGRALPGVKMFSLTPPYTTFHNPPLTLRSASASTSLKASLTLPVRVGGQEHTLKVGGESTFGTHLDERIRNGGMTWMPVAWEGLDPNDPGTWAYQEGGFIPTEWGGEVYSDAEIVNGAAFAQGTVSLGRLVLTPGVRWGLWQGSMISRSGEKVRAVEDQAVDLRMGAILDLTEGGDWVLKGHWGRYHQDLITQMFDRAGGTDVFSNQEIWYYYGAPPASPMAGFTEAERDALAEQGLFRRHSVISLNETGPVLNYRQPYVDQWLVALEKQFGQSAKFEAVFTRRNNRDMIALVDRNRDSNFTHFQRVRVHMGGPGGAPLPYAGGSVYMTDLYVPNNALREYLVACAANPSGCEPVPGLSLADTTGLSWNPDFVLTNAPDARREFWQLQLNLEISRPDWGGAVSAVWTGLKGNLDNVSGYADPSEYSPGPYVRVNEGVNAYGFLPNFSEKEGKFSIWGQLPGQFRGGAFLTVRSGDHFSPRFRISADRVFYGYIANAQPYRRCLQLPCPYIWGDPLPNALVQPLEGQDVFIGPRGRPQMGTYSNLDLRLERVFHLERFDLGLSLDLFNALGSDVPIDVQTMVNHGPQVYYFWDDLSTPFRRLWAGKWFESPLERAPPRRLRMGVTAYF